MITVCWRTVGTDVDHGASSVAAECPVSGLLHQLTAYRRVEVPVAPPDGQVYPLSWALTPTEQTPNTVERHQMMGGGVEHQRQHCNDVTPSVSK